MPSKIHTYVSVHINSPGLSIPKCTNLLWPVELHDLDYSVIVECCWVQSDCGF